MFYDYYDVAVVGAGHAGIEAGLSCARMGLQTVLITQTPDAIARMSCNPSIGGIAKGNIVREINTPSNVQVIGSSFVKYFTCPVDGGLKVFWNLTNRIPKTENNTTPLNETNENVTTPINITDEAFYEENEDVYVPDKEDNQVTNSSSIYSSPTHENKINTENATGNPIFVLFMIMILSGIVTLRRKE